MNTYHITFGTYGTRLHGGEAPTVYHAKNRPGEPFVAPHAELREENRRRMKEMPCLFDTEPRLFVETEIPAICDQGGWTYHVAAAQENHLHILLSAETDPKAVRRWLKTWLGQALDEKYGKRTWFAKGGSGKWVNDEDYFNAVYQYILKQRTHQSK